MILVFIILSIIILINLIAIILLLSNIKLELNKLHISNDKQKLKIDFTLDIAIYFLNRFKVLKITIDNEKISDMIEKGKIDIQKFKYNKKINKKILVILKNVDFEIEGLRLDGYFATINNVLSAIIFGIVNALIPILIARRIKYERYINKIKFLNIQENIINIDINCIINLKIVNIINILYFLKKKGGKDDNGEASNRRTYAYCNE